MRLQFNKKTLVLEQLLKIVSEYDQENRQSQIADKPMSSGGRAIKTFMRC